MIACLVIPYFAAAVERRHDSALARRPLAIGGQPWEAKPIYAYSREVARQGVRPGMSLRLVQVLSPQAHFMPAAPARYAVADGELVDVLLDFANLIEPEALWQPSGPDPARLAAPGRVLPTRYCLDLAGVPAQELLSLAQEMGRAVRQATHFNPAIGLAANKFAAQVAATLCRADHVRLVPPQETATFLAGRTIRFLPLPPETGRRLRLLGIETLGQLLALPWPAVRDQFGPEMAPFYRLAQGELAGPPPPPPAGQPLVVRQQFAGVVHNWLALQAAVQQAAASLAAQLQPANLAGQALALACCLADGTEQQAARQLPRPGADAASLAGPLQALLGQLSLAAGVTALTVSVAGLVPRPVRQLSLFDQPSGRSPAQPPAGEVWAQIAGQYGSGQVYRPRLTDPDHPLPERRFQLQPLAPAPTGL